MDEIFGFKFQLSYVDMPQDFFLEIPPCANHVIFIAEFVLLIKIVRVFKDMLKRNVSCVKRATSHEA